jgi:hypothetical protein
VFIQLPTYGDYDDATHAKKFYENYAHALKWTTTTTK